MLSQFLSLFKLLVQLGLLFCFWWLGGLLQHSLDLPISAAVLGLLLVLFALFSGLLRLQWIKAGSDFILGELVLLFIPCVVGIVNYKALLLAQGWQLVLTVVLGTICVMVVTAYSIHWGFKLEHFLKAGHKKEGTIPAEKQA